MNKKVICPWCGSEMTFVKAKMNYRCWYDCKKCLSKSPVFDSEEELEFYASKYYEYNLQYEQDTRLLTLDEALSVCDYIYFEEKGNKYMSDFYLRDLGDDFVGIEYSGLTTVFYHKKEYGSTWRCWTAKPTDEERQAAKWKP